MGQTRVASSWDGVVAGVSFRLKRGEGTYQKTYRRHMVELQELVNQQGSQFSTRNDMRPLFQTSWSGGTRWERPLLSQISINSYNISEGVDTWTRPGSMLPVGTVSEDTGRVSANALGLASAAVGRSIYIAGEPAVTNYTIREWDGSSWTTFTNELTTSPPVRMAYDSDNEKLVVLDLAGNLRYVNLADNGSGSITTFTGVNQVRQGSNIFFHNGRLMVYNGTTLQEVTDPYGSPAKVTIFDDGNGPDWIDGIGFLASANRMIQDVGVRLAISTAEGIYIVKNLEQEGLPTGFIYRIDRDATGTDIATPVATLPPGMVCVDVGYHLGSLLMLASGDYDSVLRNNQGGVQAYRTDLYHLTNKSLGSVGSPLGDDPDESVIRFLATYGAKVYLGGQGRVWVYDAVAGGLHVLMNDTNVTWPYATKDRLFITTDVGGRVVARVFDNHQIYWDVELYSGVRDTASNRFLESNYFDGNLPAEVKTLVGVTLLRDDNVANDTWYVDVMNDDDGVWSAAGQWSQGQAHSEYIALGTPITGYRFRYRVRYEAQTADVTDPTAVRGIVFHMVQGEFVNQWVLEIDGNEIRNVENTRQDPDTLLDSLEAIAGTQTVVNFVDQFRTQPSAGYTTHNVRIDAVQVKRSTPTELDGVTLVLVEHPGG